MSASKKFHKTENLNVFLGKIVFLRLSCLAGRQANAVEDKQKNNFLQKNRLFRQAL